MQGGSCPHSRPHPRTRIYIVLEKCHWQNCMQVNEPMGGNKPRGKKHHVSQTALLAPWDIQSCFWRGEEAGIYATIIRIYTPGEKRFKSPTPAAVPPFPGRPPRPLGSRPSSQTCGRRHPASPAQPCGRPPSRTSWCTPRPQRQPHC